MYELDSIYNSQKSFYGKAMVKEIKITPTLTVKELYSYGTLVARVQEFRDITVYVYFGSYSRTTSRHQREFFMQEGLTHDEVTKLFRSRTGEMTKCHG